MFTRENSQQITKKTKRLLKLEFQNVSLKEATEQLPDIKEVLNYHDWRYYVISEPIITDYEYDTLFKGLQALESRFTELKTEDSPTERVARGKADGFPTVNHLIPMLSLDNSYNKEDLQEYERKALELSGQEKLAFTVEPKFDGASIALIYEDDVLVRAATRGNGTAGDEITNNAKTIRSIPLKAAFSSHGIARVELRGEVVISKGNFKKLNDQRRKENETLKAEGKKELELFKNSRNTASGGLRAKDSEKAAIRRMDAFIFQMAVAEDSAGRNLLADAQNTDLHSRLKSHMGLIELLESLGFKTPDKEKLKTEDITEVASFCQSWEDKREAYDYEIDGMVVKVDDLQVQSLIGSTAHHPRWAIAYKFKAKNARTKLLHIDYQVGRTGAVTPVAKLDPVFLAGVTVSSVSLHNEEFIKEKDIHIGDTVIVERAGDVIPYIVAVIPDLRDGSEKEVIYPQSCPECETSLVKEESEAVWRCPNYDCTAQRAERLIHFVSKGAMDIDGLGKDIIRRFMSEGIIEYTEDIYQIDYEQVAGLEGWKERSINKLKQGINASKSQPLWRLLVALGIRHIGSTTAKMLSRQVENLLELKNWTQESLENLEDVGPKVSVSLLEWFSEAKNSALIEKLAELGVNTSRTEAEMPSSQVFSGKTFLFTGTLHKFNRAKAKAMVEDMGGKVLSGVSAKLDYLIAGEKAGSKLTKAQKIESISILSEDEFLEMIS